MAELTCEILVDASPETIFPLLVDREQHLRWMGTEAELEAHVGGRYSVLVGGNYPAAGEFVEVVTNERVVFTFGWEMEGGPVTPGSSTVEITLHPQDGKTLVRLRHHGLPDDAAGTEHTAGWTHYLQRLQTAASGNDNPVDTGPGAG